MNEVPKFFSRIWIVALLLQIMPLAGRAQFTFITNNGTITITGYTGSGGAVTIPATTNGLPVTTIGMNAFHLNDSVTSLTLPNSITTIEYGAFRVCYMLTNINIPGSVTSIGQYAVDGCSLLSTVTFGDGLSAIGTNMFSEAPSLTSVVIPDSVVSIGDSAFQTTHLTNVVLSGNLTNIGAYGFAYGFLTNVYFRGNAPGAATNSFLDDSGATAYYLPHTTGWSNTFAGLPTAVWPLPPAGITTYSNQPVVIVPYLAQSFGTNLVIQMTTNVATGPWVTVTNGVPILGVQLTNAPSPAFFRVQ